VDHAAGIFLFVVIAAIAIAFSFMRFAKANSVLEEWARENGYSLISAERKSLFRGPFFFTSSKSQLVYYISVEDAAGNRRSGYARVGGYMVGLLSDRVDVRWDD
jgi:hypothetical protein